MKCDAVTVHALHLIKILKCIFLSGKVCIYVTVHHSVSRLFLPFRRINICCIEILPAEGIVRNIVWKGTRLIHGTDDASMIL